MSIAAAQATKFYEQIASDKVVYTFVAENDFLVFPVSGKEVVPFWSSRSRLTKVQSSHPKYAKFQLKEMPLEEFISKALPHFEGQGIHIGVNWSGARLVGYNEEVSSVRRNLDYWLQKLAS